MENERNGKGITFTDVINGKYDHEAVAGHLKRASLEGIRRSVAPEDNITREQLAGSVQLRSKQWLHMVVAGDYPVSPRKSFRISRCRKIHKWEKLP